MMLGKEQSVHFVQDDAGKGAVYILYRMMLGKEQSVHFLQDDAGKGAVCTFCTG
jgi:hypothetical protein